MAAGSKLYEMFKKWHKTLLQEEKEPGEEEPVEASQGMAQRF